MHAQVLDFLTRTRARWPDVFGAGRVLECGSYDVNGSPRPLFATATDYVGLDWRPGPGVDAVSLTHAYTARPDGYFDTVVSTEMLEHDPHWQASLARMIELLMPGGTLLVTCAGPARPAHELDCGPAGYYHGRTIPELLDYLLALTSWEHVHAETHSSPADSYLALVGKQPIRFRPRLSVIIPAVGNVKLTQHCIASLWVTTPQPYEIILVENGSRPENREALAGLDAEIFLSFDTMLGYPAAVNHGIRLASGEYICLLNNDTTQAVTSWSNRLIATLEEMPGAMIVSPVTNFIANPAQRAEQITAAAPFLADVLYFVCVVMRRELFATTGLLDESFGLGNCEDAALCRKVVAAGGKLLVDPGVFVRHVGHATFGRLPAGMFAKLLQQNQTRLAGLPG